MPGLVSEKYLIAFEVIIDTISRAGVEVVNVIAEIADFD